MADDIPTAAASRPTPADLVELTSEIVGAYMAHNHVPAAEIPTLIASVHGALAGISAPEPAAAAPEPPKPPVPIRKTVTDEFLISLEDGKRYKTLKRHLAGRGMTPGDYRAKWGLPPDYPMVAPTYARQRSALAKEIGLGAIRRKG